MSEAKIRFRRLVWAYAVWLAGILFATGMLQGNALLAVAGALIGAMEAIAITYWAER